MNARCLRLMFLILSLVLAMLQPWIAVAQGGAAAAGATTSPYLTVVDQELAWSQPWEFVEDDAMRTSDLDLVFLTDGSATVAVSTGDIFPENARGLVIGFLGGDTERVDFLDQGVGDVTSYWFDAFPVDDEPYGAFSVATTLNATFSVLMMFISPVATFGEGMASAQSGVTLGGQPLFASVDGMALQAQLGVPADVATDTVLPEFVPEGQWVDRTYDVQVMWDKTWLPLGPEGEHSIQLGSVDSTAMLTVAIAPRDGTTPQEWADAQVQGRDDNWGSYTYLPQYVGESDVLTVGLETTGVGGLVQEVLFLDDGETLAMVSMVVFDSDPMATVGAYRASIRIDGKVPLDGIDLDAMSGMDVSLYAEAGMVEPGYYVSPQYGVELRWSDAWQLDPQATERVVSDTASGVDMVVIDEIDGESLWITMYSMSSDGLDMGLSVERLSSPEFVRSAYGPNVTVVTTSASADRGVILLKDESASPPTVTYVEMYLLDDGATFVLVSVHGAMDAAGEDIPFVQESVSLNGMRILTFYPLEDVLTLIGQ